MTGRIKATLAAIASAALLPLAAAQPLHATLTEGSTLAVDRPDTRDPFSGDCRRQQRKHLVHVYKIERDNLRVPLRCGYYKRSTDKGFGYRKIKRKHVFNLREHRNIHKTLSSPDCIKHTASRDIYFRGWAIVHHRVVDSFAFPEGYGGRLGIITAYWKTQDLPC